MGKTESCVYRRVHAQLKSGTKTAGIQGIAK